MKKNTRLALTLNRTTVRTLTESEMSSAEGAGITDTIIIRTRICPIPITTTRTTGGSAVDACPSAMACPTTTIFETGTSVINPGGGF
jgi:hypothetical protein